MNFIVTLIILIFVLGIIIFIHEFGHFLAAKKVGVYVDEFSIGMGPKIWESKRKKGKTKYSLRLLPIGGFVAMANTESESSSVKKEEILENKSFIKRFLVLVMGIIFNFVLTILLLFINGAIYGSPDTKASVGEVTQNSAAYNSGLMKNDVITSVNGVSTSSWDDVLLEITVKEALESYTFVVDRNGEEKEIVIIPLEEKDEDGKERKVFGFAVGTHKNYGLSEAVKYAFRDFSNMFKSLFRILGNLFTGKIAVDNLSGPIGIYTVIDQIKSKGLENIIYLIAYLSINVGIINLIPIPVFDGGRILLLIIEKIINKRIPEKVESIINTAGVFLLIALMLYVTLNDILKLI